MTLPFAQQSFPELYEQVLVGPLFGPWADPLLDEAGLAPSDRVLDVACGTGIVARRAKVRLGKAGTVVGVDVNAGMIAVARRIAPDIGWREGSATALPLEPEERFDVVTCQQGLQFVPDKAAGVLQMRCALAGNGRLAVSTWLPDEGFTVLRELRRVAERHVGVIDDRRHSFGDAGPLAALLRDAGLRTVQSHSETRTIRFPDGLLFARLNALALIGMSAAAKTLTDTERERLIDGILRESEPLVAQHTDNAGFAYEIGATVTIARA
ncbi:MAG TPA: methyltransferase domain-containing protein [Gemmatimonadales bacterium]|nr:methyltransferase domain-containing protein [Gemmatimonadales bacterium]